VWPLSGRGGTFRLRVGHDLEEHELEYDRGEVQAAGLLITSGELFVGPVERLPCDGFGDRLPEIPDGGSLLELAPGNWSMSIHVLDWRPHDRFWTEENEPTPDAPPDFVALLSPVDELPPVAASPTPLLELLPKKKATGKTTVTTTPIGMARRRAARERDEAEAQGQRKKRTRGAAGTSKTPKERKGAVIKVAAGEPGTLRNGCSVRHPVYGVGTILFVKDGFPKAKVLFHDQEQKVDKSDLTAIS
jgi:hypothetical protein